MLYALKRNCNRSSICRARAHARSARQNEGENTAASPTLCISLFAPVHPPPFSVFRLDVAKRLDGRRRQRTDAFFLRTGRFVRGDAARRSRARMRRFVDGRSSNACAASSSLSECSGANRSAYMPVYLCNLLQKHAVTNAEQANPLSERTSARVQPHDAGSAHSATELLEFRISHIIPSNARSRVVQARKHAIRHD
jgi:hypothetical protein